MTEVMVVAARATGKLQPGQSDSPQRTLQVSDMRANKNSSI